MPPGNEARSNRASPILFAVACLAGTLPVFLTTYPAAVDLPQHAAQVAFLDGLLHGNTRFGELFELQWFTPYWLGYALIFLLTQLVGVVAATKITLAIALVAFPLCADRFLRRMGGNPLWSYLFIPLGYGSAFEWGFLNFILAVPIGFFILSQVHMADDGYSRRDFVRIAVWWHLLFFAHALALAFFWPVAAMLLFHRNLRIWLQRLLPYFSIMPVIAIWLAMRFAADGEPRGAHLWNLRLDRVLEFLPNFVALPLSPYAYATALAVCAIPWLAGWRVAPSIKRIGPFCFYLVVILLGPHIIFNISFVYNRFAYIGIPLYFLMFEAPKDARSNLALLGGRLAGALAIALAAGLLAYGGYRAVAYEEESAGYRDIIARAEPGKRVLNMVIAPRSAFFAAPVYLHYPVWYQATHAGLVDFNFSWFVPQVVRYRADSRPAVDGRFIFAPHRFDWRTHQGHLYDYFVVRYPQDVMARLFPPGAVRLVARSGEWWLYARND